MHCGGNRRKVELGAHLSMPGVLVVAGVIVAPLKSATVQVVLFDADIDADWCIGCGCGWRACCFSYISDTLSASCTSASKKSVSSTAVEVGWGWSGGWGGGGGVESSMSSMSSSGGVSLCTRINKLR